MYTRPPSDKDGLKIPKNYSGNAFREDAYTDIKTDETPPVSDNESTTQGVCERCDIPRLEPPRCSQGDPLLFSILPNLSQKNHFPFGHGIGSEELFILGIMLLVYMSGEDGELDSELLLLLCILLFSG